MWSTACLGTRLYVAGRYIRVNGQLAGLADEIEGNRYQVGGGWFITSGLLLKAEYVNQAFKGYPRHQHP